MKFKVHYISTEEFECDAHSPEDALEAAQNAEMSDVTVVENDWVVYDENGNDVTPELVL